MWIVGDNDEEQKQNEAEVQQVLQAMVISDSKDDNGHCSSTLKPRKSFPGLVRSDLSVAVDIITGEQHNPEDTQPSYLSSEGTNGNNSKQRKKTSWSENLVKYMDESLLHDPPTAGSGSSPTMSMPITSSLTRSTSIRSHSLASDSSGVEDTERKIRYLPNGLDRAHNGLIMPTQPLGIGGSSDPHGSGIESPQWGWYINTTPPTPEMYHSRSSLKHRGKIDEMTASAPSSEITSSYGNPSTRLRGPNRVFQGLKAGSNRPAVGWPSVPL